MSYQFPHGWSSGLHKFFNFKVSRSANNATKFEILQRNEIHFLKYQGKVKVTLTQNIKKTSNSSTTMGCSKCSSLHIYHRTT